MDINLSGLPQVKAKRTFELIVDLLKEKILSGEFSPGDRLPPEGLVNAVGITAAPLAYAKRLVVGVAHRPSRVQFEVSKELKRKHWERIKRLRKQQGMRP